MGAATRSLSVAALTLLVGVACGDASSTVRADDAGGADGSGDVGRDDTGSADIASDDGETPVCTDNDGDGYFVDCEVERDCNDANADVFPGRAEECGDRFDNNCDGRVDEGCACAVGETERCYEGDPALRGIGRCQDGVRVCEEGGWGACSHGTPGEEQCDGIDNDCDGTIDDGVANGCGTCGAPPLEVCGDLLDNDCNGVIDDAEGCSCGGRTSQPCYSGPPLTLGIGQCRGGVSDCRDDVLVACLGEVLPGIEVCNGLDDDCDGEVDEGLANACGVCGAPDPLEICDGIDNDCDGEVDEGLLNRCGLCGPSGEPELCDGFDNDCNGLIDEGCGCGLGDETCWPGSPAQRLVGVCVDGARVCDVGGESWGPCEGAVLPSFETCDGLDNDCDGAIDEGRDGCSVEDCGPLCCDGVDNDCDGLVDEGLVNICGQCDEPCFVAAWGAAPSDWLLGTSDGVEIDGGGGLRLGTSAASLPYLWVANSGEASVSRINTETVTEEARYPVGSSPSRTAVDFDGNVYVANRAFGGQGTLSRVDVRDCSGVECVAYTVPIGPTDAVPRGVAVDADGYIWVGTYNDQHLRKVDPDTGLVLESHFVGRRVYGIAIDSEGIVWFSALEIPQFTGGALGAFDTNTREVVGTWTIPGCSNPYGIAVDNAGNVWLGNFTCNTLVRFRRDTETFSTYTAPGLERTRGVAVDGDGDVWLASYGTNRVAQFDPDADAFVGTYPVCTGPIGVGIANDGHIWVPCYGSDNVHRLAPDGTFAGAVTVGREPYSYSDLTGFQLRNFTARRGTWTVTFDCGATDCTFSEGLWSGAVPAETDIQLRARSSVDGAVWSPWAGPFVDSPANLSGLPPGRYVEVELVLRTSSRDVTPVLDLVEVYWARP
jgi:streptogramin lyase